MQNFDSVDKIYYVWTKFDNAFSVLDFVSAIIFEIAMTVLATGYLKDFAILLQKMANEQTLCANRFSCRKLTNFAD